jgi:hypothetical protein
MTRNRLNYCNYITFNRLHILDLKFYQKRDDLFPSLSDKEKHRLKIYYY